jgi:hypothetical protein
MIPIIVVHIKATPHANIILFLNLSPRDIKTIAPGKRTKNKRNKIKLISELITKYYRLVLKINNS